MAQQNQYAYADSSFRRIVISEEELHLRGTYSGAASYASRDAVNYGNSLYIALVSVTGTAPEGNHSDFWSALSVVQQGPPNPDDQLAQQVAEAQFTADSAVSGANFGILLGIAGTTVGSNAYALAQAAYDYALQGTSAAAALQLAQSGTAGVDQAFYLAAQGTAGANQAYALAEQGTTLATLALSWLGTLSPVDQGARDVAYSGTAGVEQAFYLAAQGTNGANFGILLASSGTNAAAYALAQALYAISIASAGTSGVIDVSAIAISGTAGVQQLYPIANSGTAGVNQVYPIAVAGTTVANAAFSLAQTATSQTSYILTVLGTTLGLVGTGTRSLFMAQLPNSSRNDIRMVIQNGVITSFGNSGFSIENFQDYAVGAIGFNQGDLGYMSFWFGTGSVNGFTNTLNAIQAFVATDTMQAYTPGTVITPGTLTAGTYWTTAYQSGSYAWPLSQDDLLAYAPGTVVGGQINAGTNWLTTGAFI